MIRTLGPRPDPLDRFVAAYLAWAVCGAALMMVPWGGFQERWPERAREPETA